MIEHRIAVVVLLAGAACSKNIESSAQLPASSPSSQESATTRGLPSTSSPPAPPSSAVQEAVAAIEQCMHWAGEDPYDRKRARFLSKAIRRDCPKAVSLARQHYAALTADPAGALNLIDLTTHLASEYGADKLLPPDDVKQVCLKAYDLVQRRAKADASEIFPYFELTCSTHTGWKPEN